MNDSAPNVGYGRPPEEHRWKKGQSGNPSGKKRSKFMEEVHQVFGAKKKVQIGERTKSVPVLHALLREVALKGIKGDNQALKLSIDLLIQKQIGINEGWEAADKKAQKEEADVKFKMFLADLAGKPYVPRPKSKPRRLTPEEKAEEKRKKKEFDRRYNERMEEWRKNPNDQRELRMFQELMRRNRGEFKEHDAERKNPHSS